MFERLYKNLLLDFLNGSPSKRARSALRSDGKDMATTEKALRESIVAHGARIVALGLGDARDCDISARFQDSLLITPSGANYASLRPAMIALMPLVGEYGAWAGPIKPSGEWRIHLDIARARPDIGAIVRFQSPYATALAMARKPIPAAHSMIALFGGPIVRCAKYAPAGTKELAGSTLEALDKGHAVLLSNYGALTTGATLAAALVRAQELERLSRLYAIALSIGRPAILSDEEVGRIAERFKSNGADVDARIGPPAKSGAKAGAAAKGKRIARKHVGRKRRS
jgi:L-fuculose-phosphate aldolase